MNLTNGAIQGIDLWSAINSAVALAQRQSLPAKTLGNSTSFDTFKASADLANGVATTKDLDIASGDLRVTGQGTANLVTQAVDYRVNAAILKGAAPAPARQCPAADQRNDEESQRPSRYAGSGQIGGATAAAETQGSGREQVAERAEGSHPLIDRRRITRS